MLQVTIGVISKQLISNKVITKKVLTKKAFTIFAYNNNGNRVDSIHLREVQEYWEAYMRSRLLKFAMSRRTYLRYSNIWPGSPGIRLVLRLQTR